MYIFTKGYSSKKMLFDNNNNSNNLKNIILITLSIYFLYPLLNSGYISDDAYDSLIKGSMLEKNINFFNTFYKKIGDG